MNAADVKQAVPFLAVSSMERSFEYYVSKLGFTTKHQWVVDGKLRWCWLELGGAALMLQERHHSHAPVGKAGEGVSLCFQCQDALAIYHDARSRGIDASETKLSEVGG